MLVKILIAGQYFGGGGANIINVVLNPSGYIFHSYNHNHSYNHYKCILNQLVEVYKFDVDQPNIRIVKRLELHSYMIL